MSALKCFGWFGCLDEIPTALPHLLGKPRNVSAKTRNEIESANFMKDLTWLANVPIFRKLPPVDIPKLAAAFTTRQYEPEQCVVSQGDNGAEFFIIQHGSATVVLRDDQGTDSLVTTLFESDYFGEGALLFDKPRAFSVRAGQGGLVVRVLSKAAFESLGLRDKLTFRRRAALVHRGGKADHVVHLTSSRLSLQRTEVEWIVKCLRSDLDLGPLLESLDDAKLQLIAQRADQVSLQPGEDAVEQGDMDADHCYLVEAGDLEVELSGRIIRTLHGGDTFGTLALLLRTPRSATVRVVGKEPCKLYRISRCDLKNAIDNQVSARLDKYLDVLKGVDLFHDISLSGLRDITGDLVEIHFDAGQYVYMEGDEGRAFYILLEGCCVQERNGVIAGTLDAGTASNQTLYFGERALIRHDARDVSTRAETAIKVLALKAESFHSLPEMRKQYKRYRTAPAIGKTAAYEYRREDLEELTTLGYGAFGKVTLQKHQPSGVKFALKSLSKGHIVEEGIEETLLAEKMVMQLCNSRFLMRMAAIFNELDHIDFLLELGAAELHAVYDKQGLYGKEDHARFYAACVSRGLAHLHEQHVLYRDLKPENLLLDRRGYCKITDFGLSKFTLGRAYTFCGTPGYMAPEFMGTNGYTEAVDWWSLGILIFELMTACLPFDGEDALDILRKSKKGISSVASIQSKEPWFGMVKDLCQARDSKRLPIRAGGIKNLENHSWFSGCAGWCWDLLETQKMPAPFQPKSDSSRFARNNFSPSEEAAPSSLTYINPGTGWDEDLEETFGVSPSNFAFTSDVDV